MSNEDLVLAIQNGEDRMEELWQQTERLVRWKAKRIMTTLNGRGGVEFDDLYQSGYPALVEAVRTYRSEHGSFATWYMFFLKTAFAETGGYRTKAAHNEPLNRSFSLDAPISEDDDGTMIELIADPAGQQGQDNVEESLWHQQLHQAVETVFKELPPQYREVMEKRYFEGLSRDEVAEDLKVSSERIRQIEQKGIRILRKPGVVCHLKPFYEFDYYCGTGLSTYRRKGLSVQEQYMIIREEQEKREARLRREAAQRLYEQIRQNRLTETGRL